jgi:hypothetical protein
MPLNEDSRNAENRILVKDDWKNAIVFGTEGTVKRIAEAVKELGNKGKYRPALAFDGRYGVQLETIMPSVREAFTRREAKNGFPALTVSCPSSRKGTTYWQHASKKPKKTGISYSGSTSVKVAVQPRT